MELEYCDNMCKLKDAIDELAAFSYMRIDNSERGRVYKIIFTYLQKNGLIKLLQRNFERGN